MIHVFHGFLGSPEDFAFLAQENVQLHHLKDKHLIKLRESDCLVGYSMGGRVALELAATVNFKVKKIILISANPGLEDDVEITQRAHWEDEILNKMKFPGFLEYWNSLPIFKYDLPLTQHLDLKLWGEIFEAQRLSKQKNFWPLLKDNPKLITFIVGESDQKYLELAKKSGLKYRTISGGHRLFQHPVELKKALIEEDIL